MAGTRWLIVPKDVLQTLLDTWTEMALICVPADYCIKAFQYR
jgi:hypothetical protein